MDGHDLAHLAGVVDTAGAITVNISKEDDYAIGYRFRPMLKLHRPQWDDVLMGKLDAYAEAEGIQYTVYDAHDSTVFEITHPESIKRFLGPLQRYMVSQYDAADLMLTTVLPAVADDEHKTKAGLYRLAGVGDQLRARGRANQKAKYDQAYFADEWNIEAAP